MARASATTASAQAGLGFLLKQAQHAYRTRIDAALRPLGLSAPQYAVLVAVAAEPGVSNATLARAAFVTPQTMQGMLVAMERGTLLVRGRHRTHGRKLTTTLTEEGVIRLHAARRLVERVEEQLAAIDEASGGSLRTVLAAVFKELGR